MPLYDYQCVHCGEFMECAPMSRAAEAVPCPACSGPGRRLISAPNLGRMNAGVRKAMRRNERAAHEPGMARRSGAGICADPERKAAPAVKAQTKVNARPWMLGH